MKDLAIIIPTHNEEATIGSLAWECGKLGDVVVVDAFSEDETHFEAFNAGARVLRYPKERGIGGAILWGMKHAQNAERVVTVDAGGSHDPADITRLLARNTDVVIGSRFCYGGQHQGRPWRSWCSQVVSDACRWRCGLPLWDWTSGFRVYSQVAVRCLLDGDYKTRGHAWQIEALGRLLRAHFYVSEVPIVYTAGRSSLRWEEIGEVVTAVRGL
jgi:glycosyltransferase involved in cell wall biosynthesis